MRIAPDPVEVHLRLLVERAEEALSWEEVADHFSQYFGWVGPEVVRQLVADAQARHAARDVGKLAADDGESEP